MKKVGKFCQVKDPESFGIFLIKKRKEIKKTIKDVAVAIGVSPQYYHIIETKGIMPAIETASKLGDFLKVSMEYLLVEAGVLDREMIDKYYKYQELSEENIFSLIKIISSLSDIPNLTISDIVFLLNFGREQKGLSLSPDLVREILKQRKNPK